MAMSTVELGELTCEWTGANGTRFVSSPTTGKGYLFVLVYTLCADGSRKPFDTVDVYAEDSETRAFDDWRARRTGYAPVGVAA